jgi:hypothetical protein
VLPLPANSNFKPHFRQCPISKILLNTAQICPNGIGLLGRLHVHVFSICHIGKESNLIEQQEEGVLLIDPQSIYWGEGDWEAIRSQLDRVSITELARQSGVSERMLRYLREGKRQPSREKLEAIAGALGRMLGNS